MDKTALFEQTPVKRALIIMAIPTIISQLITMIYNLADTFFIGLTNDPYKVAAASVVSVLFFILNSMSNLFGIGGGSLLARLLGQKREDEAKKVGAFSIYGALVLAAVYAVFSFLFSERLVRLMGASDYTARYAENYLFWVVVVGAIPSTTGLTMSHLIRSAGYSKEAGLGLAIGGVSNIILDPLFMFVILPTGNEVTGAAIATLLSNTISLLYFIHMYVRLRGKTVLTLSPSCARPSRTSVREIFAVGLPSAITSLLANLTSLVKNNLTSSYGDIEMAAFGIVQKVDMLPLNIGMGLCQGMMPLVAYNYSARNYKRMRDFTRAAQLFGVVVAGIFIVLCEVFAPHIIGVFIKDEMTISYGTDFLRIACLATPLMISNFQKIYCLQAMGKGKESLLLGISRQGLLAIPTLLLLNYFLGLYGVVSAQLVSDSITFMIASLIYRKTYLALQQTCSTHTYERDDLHRST